MYLFKLGKLKLHRKEKIGWILASGLINKDVWLAGGALRTMIDPKETIVDYDLFFKRVNHNSTFNTQTYVFATRKHLEQLGFRCTFKCPEGKLYAYEKTEIVPIYTLRETPPPNKVTKVQLITEFFYSSPEELLSTFDLSPTYFCTDGEYLWTNKKAIFSVKKKICDLMNITYPVSTFKRIIKYYDKKYSCLPAIQKYVDNLIQSNASKFSEESMRVYID